MFSPLIKKSFGAAAAGSVWVATASTAFAEEKRSKLSIYDEPETKVVIIESPTKLEEHVYIAQKYANDTLNEGKNRVEGIVKQYEDLETKVKTNINNTIDKDEEIFPNLFYVGVAALGGTILARNRNIVLRFLTSTTLALGASHYLLPKTTHNVALQVEKFEKQYPQLEALHQQVSSSVQGVCQQVEGTVAQVRGAVDENTQKLRQQIEVNTHSLKEQVNSAVAFDAKDKFDEVKKNVESMYTTRSKPGVEETLKKEN